MPNIKYQYKVKKWNQVSDDAEIHYPIRRNNSNHVNDLLLLACSLTLGVLDEDSMKVDFSPKSQWSNTIKEYNSSYSQVNTAVPDFDYVIVRIPIE